MGVKLYEYGYLPYFTGTDSMKFVIKASLQLLLPMNTTTYVTKRQRAALKLEVEIVRVCAFLTEQDSVCDWYAKWNHEKQKFESRYCGKAVLFCTLMPYVRTTNTKRPYAHLVTGLVQVEHLKQPLEHTERLKGTVSPSFISDSVGMYLSGVYDTACIQMCIQTENVTCARRPPFPDHYL